MWAPVGAQPEVPAPGQNQKEVVYGGVDYVTGKITYTIAATKSGVNFLAFLIALAAAYAGRKVRLVCDNGRFHCTKAVQLWLEQHRRCVRSRLKHLDLPSSLNQYELRVHTTAGNGGNWRTVNPFFECLAARRS